MPVSHLLQDVVSDVSIAITQRDVWGRAELEKLRRTLNELQRDAAAAERAAGTAAFKLGELVAGVKAGAADLLGLARRAETAVAPESGQ